MADIDFTTDISNGFTISIGRSPSKVSGNRAMLNRFEITFLTKLRTFYVGGRPLVDGYGGDAHKYMIQPGIVNDTSSISISLSAAIENTVDSILKTQDGSTPNTEKLASASLLSVDIIDDMVTASIEVVPVEAESYDIIKLNLPITIVRGSDV